MKKTKDNITKDLKAKQRTIADVIPKKAFNFFRKETPIKSGYARRHTFLRGDTIYAMYDYATKLNKGHSKQAPQGMEIPMRDYLERLIPRLLRKK